ncbi:hypothetical protein Bbelb_039280 [Branchiostoma belcheri]|nr:hypothetical protein Bbelb_039280 [Branchiostoma belcheri]
MAESALLLEEVRTLIKDREEPFNILILGCRGVGKSTLINSSHMAVAHTWNEFAFGGGGGINRTVHIIPYTMFKPEFMKRPIDGYRETIKMWDMPGMEDFEYETYIEVIGLLLEGRIPENTSLTPILLLSDRSLTRAALDRRFPKTVEEQRIHRVIMVCDANRDVPENLIQTVRRAAKTPGGRRIPIVVVFSTMDTVTDKPAYRKRRYEALNAFEINGKLDRFFETGLYTDRNSLCSRGLDWSFNKNEEIDTTLLAMWRVLLNPAYDESIRYEHKEHSPWYEGCNIS